MSEQPINKPKYVIGVDVGTGSARAGVFDQFGQMLGNDKYDIEIYREGAGIVEQSSENIWQAVSKAVRGAMAKAALHGDDISGIGFDATCSLVILGNDGEPLPASNPLHPNRNVIVWMDHRALAQAERINTTKHRVLDYVGGRISPEMETPKLLWLKENRPEIYHNAWQFMDLTDFLTWRSTGDLARSVCTVTCKWTYMAHEGAWDSSYFNAIGLSDLVDDGFARIGTRIVDAGSQLGNGLTMEAAQDLGLRVGTPVGAGLIDAHAGGIGSIDAIEAAGGGANLAYVFGTSSCTMTTTREPVFVPGVWGPYFSAMVPGAWLNEGGQSAAGAAIDQLLRYHPYSTRAEQRAADHGLSLPEWLTQQVELREAPDRSVVDLAKGIHIVPEFLGNRAPHADPNTRAVIAGLGMDEDLDSLLALYVAGICGIGYGLRQIMNAQAIAGAPVEQIVISGGAGRSTLVRQLLADATGVGVAAPRCDEPVLLGSAILGAVAGDVFGDIGTAVGKMSRLAEIHKPGAGAIGTLHDERFAIFEKLQGVARHATEV